MILIENMWATTNLGSKLPSSPETPASAAVYRSGNHLIGVGYEAAGNQQLLFGGNHLTITSNNSILWSH